MSALRDILWWLCFLAVAVGIQAAVPGLDVMAVGLIILLQERDYKNLLWLLPAFILSQKLRIGFHQRLGASWTGTDDYIGTGSLKGSNVLPGNLFGSLPVPYSQYRFAAAALFLGITYLDIQILQYPDD